MRYLNLSKELIMKFEEALTKMREGSKITHPSFEEDVYLQACRVGIIFDSNFKETWPISIVKMKGDRQHEDMMPIHRERCIHGLTPQLNLFLVMSEDWEVID